MTAGTALVRAYLELNGYFVSTDVPVVAEGQGGRYQEVTDLDVLAVRLPGATHVVPRGRPGPEDDLRLGADPLLEADPDAVDVVVGEVKEGRARLNDATRAQRTLYAALTRVGCVPPERMEATVRELAGSGRARIAPGEGGVPARIRLLAFGDGDTGWRSGYRVVSLAHVAAFVEGHLERYHDVLHPADLRDPVLGLLHLLRKLR